MGKTIFIMSENIKVLRERETKTTETVIMMEKNFTIQNEKPEKQGSSLSYTPVLVLHIMLVIRLPMTIIGLLLNNLKTIV
jgi:hypothetical protein